jgi:hypothetical protein
MCFFLGMSCQGSFLKWSRCDKICGKGNQFRIFHIKQRERFGGQKCFYPPGYMEQRVCFRESCGNISLFFFSRFIRQTLKLYARNFYPSLSLKKGPLLAGVMFFQI